VLVVVLERIGGREEGGDVLWGIGRSGVWATRSDGKNSIQIYGGNSRMKGNFLWEGATQIEGGGSLYPGDARGVNRFKERSSYLSSRGITWLPVEAKWRGQGEVGIRAYEHRQYLGIWN